ncbi:hypothetical protein P152DRAFT_381794, partial [Eremomyces bilateralis CBS 781.70]
RKRTKTGCLTCRKRRIKCGEEKPVCGNCIKSKRHCEGYNQRVIFKPPIDNWPSNTGIHTLQYHTDQTSSYPSTHPQSSAQPSLPTASGHGLEHDSFNAIHAWQSSQQTRLIPPSHSDDISPPINDGSFQNLPPAPQTTGDSGPSVDGSIQTSATTPMTSESQKSYNIPFSSGATDVHPASAVWFPRTTAQDILEAGAVESHDDDFFDVEPEDDQAFALELASNQNHDFNSLIALHKQSISDFSTRGYDAFLTPDLLDIYHPEYAANPLKNEATRRIFAHFIHATGPSLSIYERNPGNASGLFSEVHIPRSQQNLWTYTLPVLAINDQALLQVMLALGSLHIAKLQGASEMPSLKHYGYAIKRINKRLSDESKRHQATTLAASLLLGFYEVMAGEHMRWSTHIQGAQKLIVEIDYVGMTKQLRKSREAEASQKQNHKGMSDWHISLSHDAQKDAPNEVDEGVLSTLVGREVRFDDFGQVEPEGSSSQGRTNPKKGFHLDHYDIYQDLFWWYCRQDAYQSIISGEPLLMSYDKWTDCPPRAKLGKAAVYGTHDHLILLLGRISDFAARDRPRKTRQLQAFGPQWKTPGPPPGMGRGGPPSGMAGRPGQNQPSVDPNAFPAGPRFIPRPPRAGPSSPSSRSDASHSSSTSSKKARDIADLPAATAAALEEWNSILKALTVFEMELGPNFQPLSPEFAPTVHTPFGPAMQYRSFDRAVVWGLYHMCHLILQRSHPTMPPAAMMAAAVSGHQTAQRAQEIGRVAAGIIDSAGGMGSTNLSGAPHAPLNPSLGAAIYEITVPLFFAGIQFMDPSQREWLVDRVLMIHRRTGFQSAGAIAMGCESAWENAALRGGPPYTR